MGDGTRTRYALTRDQGHNLAPRPLRRHPQSDRRDSNPRPPGPQPGALPPAPRSVTAATTTAAPARAGPCPREDSNLHCAGFEPAASTSWATRATSSEGRTRTCVGGIQSPVGEPTHHLGSSGWGGTRTLTPHTGALCFQSSRRQASSACPPTPGHHGPGTPSRGCRCGGGGRTRDDPPYEGGALPLSYSALKKHSREDSNLQGRSHRVTTGPAASYGLRESDGPTPPVGGVGPS